MKTPAVSTPTRSTHPPGGADRILLAKITAPSVPGWMVPRPRIEQRIEEGTAGPLTVVTGPPGAGKTMAVASWAAARPGPVAWVTLDHYDSRPKVFWSTIVEALRSAGVTLRWVTGAPARTPTAGHVFLLRLASELAAQDPPVTLVLDDLHLLTGSGLMDGLHYLMQNAKSGLRLVVCSRTDPLLPLHRYRLAGELTEIRASELAFSVPEARLLMAQHGITLPPRSLELLTKLDEGWAAGLRLAAISLGDHPDPGQFIKEFAAENSAIAGYLVAEALNNQPAHIRDLLLKTSILDRVSPGIASELTGNEQAASALAALARANAFVQPLGNGWYRYHSLFAEVLRLKLRLESPGQVPDLHRRAARWYQVNGLLLDAVRQAVAAGDWPLAAQLILDELAIGQLAEPHGGNPLADCFRPMPDHRTWAGPQPALIAAALELADGQLVTHCEALDAAAGILEDLPADQETSSRLAAAMLRLAVARRAGDLDAATAAMARVEKLLELMPGDNLARHAEIQASVLSARGVVQFWSGHLDEAAASLEAGVAAAAACGSLRERNDGHGYLALLEAMRGRLSHAAELAAEAAGPADPGLAGPACGAAEVALACAHLERNELHDTRDRLKRADAALRIRPEKLVGAMACLVAARYRLAEGRARAASEMTSRARHGWSPPSWLDHRLSLLESRAYAALGDVSSAVDAARRADPAASLDATVALVHAWLDGGDSQAARHALENGPDDAVEVQDHSRLDRWLADARLGYSCGDQARGRRSLQRALRLGESEQLRLSFAMEAAWIHPVLRSDPQLADAHQHLLEPGPVGAGRGRAGPPATEEAAPVIVEQLSGREREVLGLLSGMLSTAEVASELYISVNTVKTHLKSIYRKLAATHRGEAVRRARQLELLLPLLPLKDAHLTTSVDGLLPGGDSELPVNRAYMGLDRVRRQEQLLPDPAEGQRALQKPQHVFLAIGKRLHEQLRALAAGKLLRELFGPDQLGLRAVRPRCQHRPGLAEEAGRPGGVSQVVLHRREPEHGVQRDPRADRGTAPGRAERMLEIAVRLLEPPLHRGDRAGGRVHDGVPRGITEIVLTYDVASRGGKLLRLTEPAPFDRHQRHHGAGQQAHLGDRRIALDRLAQLGKSRVECAGQIQRRAQRGPGQRVPGRGRVGVKPGGCRGGFPHDADAVEPEDPPQERG